METGKTGEDGRRQAQTGADGKTGRREDGETGTVENG